MQPVPRMHQLTLLPPWAYREIPGDLRVRIRTEEGQLQLLEGRLELSPRVRNGINTRLLLLPAAIGVKLAFEKTL